MTNLQAPASPKSRQRVPKRAWLITGLMCLFMVLNFADKAVIGFAGVDIQRDLQISPEQYGLLQSSFFWLFAVGAVVLGLASNRVGLRWMLAILMVVWVATMAPMLGTVSFGVMVACRVVLGFAEGPAYAMAMHAVHSWFPADRRALPSGIVTAGSSIGPLLAAPLLTWVIVTWSWHVAFGILMVCGLLWAVLWLVVGRNTPASGGSTPTTNATETRDADDELPDVPFRRLWRNGTLIGVGLLLFFSYWVTSLKVSWLPTYLTEGLGYGQMETGQLLMLPYASSAVFAIGVGWLSNRLVARGVSHRIARGFLAGGLVVAAGLLMACFTALEPGPLQMALIVLVFSLNSGAFGVAFVAVSDVVHARKRGAVLSMLVAFYSLAGVVAPLIIGHFVGQSFDRGVGFAHGFLVCGLIIAAGGACGAFLVRPERERARLRAEYKH